MRSALAPVLGLRAFLPLTRVDLRGRQLHLCDEASDIMLQLVYDVEQGFRRMEATGLAYYSGDDGLNFAWLAHGASGVVSVVTHADAHSWHEMITEVDDGDLAGARVVARRIRPLVQAIMGGGQGVIEIGRASCRERV